MHTNNTFSASSFSSWVFTGLWHCCCFSIKRSRLLSIISTSGSWLLPNRKCQTDFFSNSLCFGLANVLIVCNYILYENCLTCRVSVTLCFHFLCLKMMAFLKKYCFLFFSFFNCIKKVINSLSLFRTGKYQERHLLTLSKYKFASKLRPNMEKFRVLGEYFV